jgi:transmembrane sensor
MEPDEPLSDLDPLLCEALSWVVRLVSGEATRADLDDLLQWRRTSREHEEAFREAAWLWRACADAARESVEETVAAPPSDAARSDLLQESSTGGDVSINRLSSDEDR